MKSRFAALLLAIIMTLSLAACGQQPAENTASDAPENKNTESTANVTISTADQTIETNGSNVKKVLVAYFTAAENSDVDAVSSASVVTVGGTAKGRVQALAEMIQAETGGDLFSIRTSTEYPGDGGKLIDFAAEEQNANARPELTSHIENLDDYDVIFVGYPNWWYDMPMVLYSFFEEYDFSGKTIIPFNVHNGSRFSSTIATIQGLEPDAAVITDGFTVSERTVADCQQDVSDWLDTLGY